VAEFARRLPKKGANVDELTLVIDRAELAGLRTLIGSGTASAADLELVARDLLRTALAARLAEAVPAPLRSRRTSVRTVLWAALAVAFAVALVGGYGAGWHWTGFRQNKQLWDWLELLLLPVAFGTLPLWLRHSNYMGRVRQVAFATVVAAFAVFVVVGYLEPLGWTGFGGNRLWDWLTLVLLPVTVITARTWTSMNRSVRIWHVAAVAVVGVGWLVTVVGGYAWSWAWTGYQGNTLWDWLQLVLLPIVFPTILAPALLKFVTGDVETRAPQSHRLASDAHI
jgi:hypothetical protein